MHKSVYKSFKLKTQYAYMVFTSSWLILILTTYILLFRNEKLQESLLALLSRPTEALLFSALTPNSLYISRKKLLCSCSACCSNIVLLSVFVLLLWSSTSSFFHSSQWEIWWKKRQESLQHFPETWPQPHEPSVYLHRI